MADDQQRPVVGRPAHTRAPRSIRRRGGWSARPSTSSSGTTGSANAAASPRAAARPRSSSRPAAAPRGCGRRSARPTSCAACGSSPDEARAMLVDQRQRRDRAARHAGRAPRSARARRSFPCRHVGASSPVTRRRGGGVFPPTPVRLRPIATLFEADPQRQPFEQPPASAARGRRPSRPQHACGWPARPTAAG